MVSSAKACSIMIENLPLMLEKLSEAKKPDDVRNYLLPLLGRALAQEKQTNLQVMKTLMVPRHYLTILGSIIGCNSSASGTFGRGNIKIEPGSKNKISCSV